MMYKGTGYLSVFYKGRYKEFKHLAKKVEDSFDPKTGCLYFDDNKLGEKKRREVIEKYYEKIEERLESDQYLNFGKYFKERLLKDKANLEKELKDLNKRNDKILKYNKSNKNLTREIDELNKKIIENQKYIDRRLKIENGEM